MPRAARRPVRRTQKKKKSPAAASPPVLDVRSEADVKKALEILRKYGLVVVLVFANWCPHCHSYMPTWKNLAKTPNRSAPMISVEQAHADPILKAMGTSVDGFPTVYASTHTQDAQQPNVGEPIANPREEATMRNLLVNGASALGNQAIPNGNVESAPEPATADATAAATPVPSATPAAMSNEPVTLPTVANSIKASNKASANSRRMADQMLNSGFTAPPDVDLATPPSKESLNMTAKPKQAGGNPAAAAGTLFDALSSYSAGSAVSKLASIAGLLGTYHMVAPATRRVRSGRSRATKRK